MSIVSGIQAAGASRAIVPSDADDFETQYGAGFKICRSIYVGSTGNIVIVDPTGTEAKYLKVPAGKTLECMAKQVKQTLTTASDMMAMF